jgi:L-ascorbate metabolism protein UlaG (beta-lactamase superfamily)
MKIGLRWFGHSTWMVNACGIRILVDPFLDDNPSSSVKASEVTPDFILISHGHFDHLADAAQIANRTNCPVYCNYEIAQWLGRKHGVTNAIGMNIGGKAKAAFGELQMVSAVHSSGLPDGEYGGLASGFVLRFLLADEKHTLYYTGDTAVFGDMAYHARQGIDTLIVPIGDLFTMGPDESIDAVQLVKPKYVVPCHYNTWPPIAQDAHSWADTVRSMTSSVPLVLSPGEQIEI